MKQRLNAAGYIDNPIILHIFSYHHNQLHQLVSKRLSEYAAGGKKKESDKYLPISLLIKIHIFREYSSVCLSNRFKFRICSISAQIGNLSALKWAREQGCPWDSDTPVSATAWSLGGLA
jgi:hypothetical protein